MIREGQIWVRHKDNYYLPDDVWKVRIVKSDRNGITYRVIEYNGKPTDGVQISTTVGDFKEKYYQERGECA